MLKTMYADDATVNRLIEAVGEQAAEDYVRCNALHKRNLRTGKENHYHYHRPQDVMEEIEIWFRMMFDYEAAEYYIERIRQMTPADLRAIKRRRNGGKAKHM